VGLDLLINVYSGEPPVAELPAPANDRPARRGRAAGG
jgi:hypothetical protein